MKPPITTQKKSEKKEDDLNRDVDWGVEIKLSDKQTSAFNAAPFWALSAVNIWIIAGLHILFFLSFLVILLGWNLFTASHGSLQDVPETQEVQLGTSKLAFKLLPLMAENNANIIFSPLSLVIGLSMILEGSKGHTAEEICSVLNWNPASAFEIQNGLGFLLRDLNRKTDIYTKLYIGGNIFIQKNFEITSKFNDQLKQNYECVATEVNFVEEEETREIINTWVSKKTWGQVRELLRPNQLDLTTRLLMTTVMYFKGQWLHAFPKQNTFQTRFYVQPDDEATVHMMHTTGNYNYGEFTTLGLQSLELPIDGDKLSLLLILPNKPGRLSEVRKILQENPEILSELNGHMKNKTLYICLPKFKIDGRLSLHRHLSELGLKLLFDAKYADLSGISSQNFLFVKEMVQSARLEVDEIGAEAAAITELVAAERSLVYDQLPVFCANHPFLFILRDLETNMILLMGQYTDPRILENKT
ncbi:serpin B6-like [Tachypleus tridentatus]|uniref:serpin B6-like n=1 Tax=Tachypleus tridentatus TaxID=6853 RepID=UPI003FD1F555